MAARNGPDSYGWVSRALHWVMALAILGMLGLGTFIAGMEPSLGNLWLYGLHKSVGLCLLLAVVLRLIWHRISPPPATLTAGIGRWQLSLAHAVHLGLYGLLLAVPLTGWIASAATGIDVMLFDTITLPRIAPVSEAWDATFFALHGILTKVLLALVALHVAGAVVRHVLHRDATLRRMLRG